MLYYELVDHLGHEFGPKSKNLSEAVRQIDSILYDLYNEIIERKLDKTVNVVIVSDHGMTDLSGFQKIFLNESVIDYNNLAFLLSWGSGSQVIPMRNKEDQLMKQLSNIKGMKAYRKNEIPEKFHYKNNSLVLPILLMADIGYTITPPKLFDLRVEPIPSHEIDKEPLVTSGGGHGYDREFNYMHAIMYGFGPAFKKNFTSGPIEMVDHYNIFCNVLGITPHPNNGSFDRVKHFLKEHIIAM